MKFMQLTGQVTSIRSYSETEECVGYNANFFRSVIYNPFSLLLKHALA